MSINAPLVLQCRSCRTIIGDSLAMVGSDEASQTLTLCNVQNLRIVVKGGGKRCVCETCGEALGIYARSNYVLDVEMISSYEIGSTGIAEDAQAPAKTGAKELLDDVSQDIAAMKNVMLHFSERLKSLESENAKSKAEGLELRRELAALAAKGNGSAMAAPVASRQVLANGEAKRPAASAAGEEGSASPPLRRSRRR